ncbi:MAG: glycosyltransferase family 4 protein [Thermoleophilia bacterium]
MRTVHVVVPEGIDDPTRPSGGNVYDRRVCRGLAGLGWSVHEHAVPGGWPHPDAAAHAALGDALAGIPEDAVVLVDGIIASTAPEHLTAHAHRVRPVVLMHMPLGDGGEGTAPDAARREAATLAAAAAVITTSAFTRRRLLDRYGLPAHRVHVARPGTDAAPLARGSTGGGVLLCVAAVTRGKGHDVLLEALATVADLPWTCVCAGSLGRDPQFVAHLRARGCELGLDHRVDFAGPHTGRELRRRYAAADLVVLASRAETFGMVLTEALAHGVPVLATRVGGVTEAVGHGADGTVPGLLVPPGDPAALGAALRRWLCDASLRGRLRRAARQRRASLAGWPATVSVLDHVLGGVCR